MLFRELRVEDAILLLIETDTPEAVVAPETIFAELTIPAVRTVLAVVRHVAIGTIDALVAPLTPKAERETATADAFA